MASALELAVGLDNARRGKMKAHNIVFLTTIAFVLGGCITYATSTFNYEDGGGARVKNETVVNKPFEDVWNGLVKRLAKSFFIINNIEKASRLINVSYSTDSPEEYIDCGNTTRTFTHGDDNLEFHYEVAADSFYKYATGDPSKNEWLTGEPHFVGYVERSTNLEGRINIYIAPKEQKTDVAVNTRYILTITTSGQITRENVYGNVVESNALTPSSSVISFNTNQPNKSNEGISCFSKGVLEAEILEMAKAD